MKNLKVDFQLVIVIVTTTLIIYSFLVKILALLFVCKLKMKFKLLWLHSTLFGHQCLRSSLEQPTTLDQSSDEIKSMMLLLCHRRESSDEINKIYSELFGPTMWFWCLEKTSSGLSWFTQWLTFSMSIFMDWELCEFFQFSLPF